MGAVNTTYTFTSTDTITSGKMNNIIDQTVMTDDAVFTGGTVEVSGGRLRVRSGSITSNELSTGSVTSNALALGSVTSTAIADGTIVDADVNASAAIAPTKLGTGTLPSTVSVSAASISNGSITAPKLSGAQSGVAPIYGARAWCSFDATRDSSGATSSANTARFLMSKGNILSVVKTGTGAFTVNFESATPMPTSTYAVIGGNYDTDTTVNGFTYVTQSTSSFTILTENTSGAPQNFEINSLVVFG